MEKTGLLAAERQTGNTRIVLSADDKNVICLQINVLHNMVTTVSFSRGYFDFLQSNYHDIKA